MLKTCRVGDPEQSLPSLLFPCTAEERQSGTVTDLKRVDNNTNECFTWGMLRKSEKKRKKE